VVYLKENQRVLIMAIMLAVIVGIGVMAFLRMGSFPFNSPPTTKWVNMMSGNISLNYTEVERINETSAKTNLAMIDFGIENKTIGSGYYRDYYIFMPRNKSYDRFKLEIMAESMAKQAWMEVSFIASFPETELSTQKKFANDMIKDVANRCDLNVNIAALIWNVHYQD